MRQRTRRARERRWDQPLLITSLQPDARSTRTSVPCSERPRQASSPSSSPTRGRGAGPEIDRTPPPTARQAPRSDNCLRAITAKSIGTPSRGEGEFEPGPPRTYRRQRARGSHGCANPSMLGSVQAEASGYCRATRAATLGIAVVSAPRSRQTHDGVEVAAESRRTVCHSLPRCLDTSTACVRDCGCAWLGRAVARPAAG
jgi:hypothetical protein